MRPIWSLFPLLFGTLLLLRSLAADDDRFIRTLTVTRNFSLGRPVKPAFTPDGGTVLFLRSGPRDARQSLYGFNVGTGITREILTGAQLAGNGTEQLSAEEKARRERQRITVGGIVGFECAPDGIHLLVPFSGRLYWFNRTNGVVRELAVPGPVIDPRLSPDGTRVAYVRDHDLWVWNLGNHHATHVTQGGSESVTHGEAEFVAQEEMYRSQGYWWSPDGRRLLFEESDAREVEVWRVGDPMRPEKTAAPQSYPRPGHPNVRVRLGLVSVSGGSVTWISWDRERYPYFTKADWHESGGLTIAVQTRDQRELAVLRVDPRTGGTSPLVIERDAAWVNLDATMPHWLKDGRRFLWTTERSGGWELELRETNDRPARVLVPRSCGWRGLVRVDDAAGEVWFQASTDPTEQHLWRVSLDGGPCRSVTETPGIQTAVVARQGGRRVVTSAAPEHLAESVVSEADGTELGRLPSVAEEPGFVPRAEFVRVGAGEGYHAKIVRPREFVSGRRYPVIVDVYGGPHAQVVTRTLASSLVDQWIADQGFVVVAMDGRGTPGRGRDWERAIAGRLGVEPLAGQVEALTALGARFPELDLARVGITGWSFGGYLSVYAVLRRPEVFRAAVAGAPVTDWEDYDTHYTERYLGLLPGAAAAYKENSCLTFAGDLSRPLLLIHGTGDDNVYFRHSLRLTDALVRSGRPFEFLPLAGFTHLVPDPVVAEQRWSRTVEFFRRQLTD